MIPLNWTSIEHVLYNADGNFSFIDTGGNKVTVRRRGKKFVTFEWVKK